MFYLNKLMSADLSKYKSNIKITKDKEKKQYLEIDVLLPIESKENSFDPNNEHKYLFYFVKEKNYYTNYKLGKIENFDGETLQFFTLNELLPPITILSPFLIRILYIRLKHKQIKFKKSLTFLTSSCVFFGLSYMQYSISNYNRSFLKKNILTNGTNDELNNYNEWKNKNSLV